MSPLPTARADLVIESRPRAEGPAWCVQAPGEPTLFWFGPQEIQVLRALDGRQDLDDVARRLGPRVDGGEDAVRALAEQLEAAGLLEADGAPVAAAGARESPAPDTESRYWGQLLPTPLAQVLPALAGAPAAAADCERCELTCCAYSVSVGREEAERIVAAVAEGGRWRRGIFDGGEYTGAGRLFRIARHAGDTSETGSCIFLETDKRCQVQRLGGLAAKPVVCRLFPARPLLTPDGPRTSLRPGCPHPRHDASPAAVAAHDALLAEASALRGTLIAPSAPAIVVVTAGRSVPWAEYRALEDEALAALAQGPDASTALAAVAARVAAEADEAPRALDADHLERLAGSLAPMLANLRGQAVGDALIACGRPGSAPARRHAPASTVARAVEALYPLQFASWLGGLGVLRLLVATADRHPDAARRPLEVTSSCFRGFRTPPLHIALASLSLETLESLAVTPGL